MFTSSALADETVNQDRWLFSQYTKNLGSNFDGLRDNRLVNAIRSTRDAITIDFTKPQEKYIDYNWNGSSVREETIKLNIQFKFH